MKQQIAVGVTAINLVLMIFLLAQLHTAKAQKEQSLQVLRGKALEIVDDMGRRRASLTIEPPITVDGKLYPETVLFRMYDTKKGPVVKLTAAENGAGLILSDESNGGVQVLARQDGSFMKIADKDGKEQVIKP